MLGEAIVPEPVKAEHLGVAYAEVIRAHEALRQTLSESGDPGAALREVYRRCTELVAATGRVVRSGDALIRYLGSRTPLAVEAEAARLDELAARSRDPGTADAYRLGAEARRHQLALYRRIGALHDRIEARLALVTSFLAAVEALVVEVQARDIERLHAEITAISDHVDELDGDIGLLASGSPG